MSDDLLPVCISTITFLFMIIINYHSLFFFFFKKNFNQSPNFSSKRNIQKEHTYYLKNGRVLVGFPRENRDEEILSTFPNHTVLSQVIYVQFLVPGGQWIHVGTKLVVERNKYSQNASFSFVLNTPGEILVGNFLLSPSTPGWDTIALSLMKSFLFFLSSFLSFNAVCLWYIKKTPHFPGSSLSFVFIFMRK